MSAGTGDAPVLPSPRDATQCISPRCRPHVVEEGRDPRGGGAEVTAWLALTQTKVCHRPDGQAAQGALRAGRVEGMPRRCSGATRGQTPDNSGRHWKAAGGLTGEIPTSGNHFGGNPALGTSKFSGCKQL